MRLDKKVIHKRFSVQALDEAFKIASTMDISLLIFGKYIAFQLKTHFTPQIVKK